MSEVQGLCPSTVGGAWPPLFGAWAVEEIVGSGGRRLLLQEPLSQGSDVSREVEGVPLELTEGYGLMLKAPGADKTHMHIT